MDENDERRKKRNERVRLTYRMMDPQRKAKLLQCRRDQYRQRIMSAKRAKQQQQFGSVLSSTENINTSQIITQTPGDICYSIEGPSSYPNINCLPDDLSMTVLQYNNYSEQNESNIYLPNGNQAYQPGRNEQSDCFTWLASVFSQPWELPSPLKCQNCRALRYILS
ncbi:hypothetical protein CDL12_13649 [Handroanthus impetiginosus]|uniref:Uncharacterized protein n=1 Tax=Handroanthus impetiginosus TaxID=429701 RepID=A0A2G9H877_9LAMI|nr:hypothetical protein CDL12_13649 [Handroanthus impetiginosus]